MTYKRRLRLATLRLEVSSLVLCMACATTSPDASKLPPAQDASIQSGNAPVNVVTNRQQSKIVASPQIAAEEVKEASQDTKVFIEARFPQIKEWSGAGGEDFNQAVNSSIRKKIADFKKETAEFEPADSNSSGHNIRIDYEIMAANANVVSVRFTKEVMFAGAAYPDFTAFVFNYNLRTNRPLKLVDLFKPGKAYLLVLSRYSARVLQGGKYADAVDTSVESEDYSKWNVTPRGLVVNFSAPHALGSTAEVVVPYEVVKDIINPDGPLAWFANGQ